MLIFIILLFQLFCLILGSRMHVVLKALSRPINNYTVVLSVLMNLTINLDKTKLLFLCKFSSFQIFHKNSYFVNLAFKFLYSY